MAKIKIQELCDKLKSDIDEKGIFFKELSAKEFLIPFYNANLFDFTDNASYWVIQYLQKIYAEDTKDVILSIINHNIEHKNINEIDYSTYIQLIKLLELLDIETFNKVKATELLKHKYSMDFILSLYKNNEIYKNTKLVRISIDSLLRYKIIESYKTICQIDYESYQLSELLSSIATKENFEMALKQDFLFNILIRKYKEVYTLTHKTRNDITDVFSQQFIDLEEIRAKLINDYHIEDISDVILYFLCINLNGNNIQSDNIKKLLSHRIFMLRKLGLYIISLDISNNIYLLPTFLENINKTNIIKVTNICLYEIINIFQKISTLLPDDIENPKSDKCYNYLDKSIQTYLQLFSSNAEELKYRVLHGLKEHPKFKNLFYELKNKYMYEKENPGIYFESGIGGWVKNKSPISEGNFRVKSIQEQIEYLNSNIQYNRHLIPIDKDNVEEVNERGLAELFKKILEEDINIYLSNENIFKIAKKEFIQALLEVILQKAEDIKNINNVILFFNHVFSIVMQDTNRNRDLLYLITDFNIYISEKRHKDFHKIFKFIEAIAKNNFDENYENNDTDLSFNALNTLHGRNFRCYMNHIVKIKKIKEPDNSFLNYILNKDNEERFYTFYYYLGMQYQYLSYRYKELNLLEKVYKLHKKARRYFLNGYLAYFCYIPPFIDLKPLILEAFKNGEIYRDVVRTRFVRMLLDLKLRFNMDDVFKEFSKYFTEKDYHDTLRGFAYNENKKYTKEMILNYWHEIMALNDKNYTSTLLDIFNKYCDLDDMEKYEEDLKYIIRLGLPTSLVANRSIIQFLEKLLHFLELKRNSVVVYNILDEIISSMKTVKYIYKELDTIKEILNEFKKQDKGSNAQLIAEKIYRIPNIKYYATNLKEFLI